VKSLLRFVMPAWRIPQGEPATTPAIRGNIEPSCRASSPPRESPMTMIRSPFTSGWTAIQSSACSKYSRSMWCSPAGRSSTPK